MFLSARKKILILEADVNRKQNEVRKKNTFVNDHTYLFSIKKIQLTI